MAHKSELGTDARGNYRRRLGRRQDGQIQTFYLGTDRTEANRRNALLEALAGKCSGQWDETTLLIAKALARGEKNIEVPPPDDLRGSIQRDVHRMMKQEVAALGYGVVGQPGLHAALQEYQETIKKQKKAIDGDTSEWGQKVVEMVQRLIERHENIPLASLDLAKCEEMLHYWKNRPAKKNSTEPIAKNTARNQLIQLRAFFRWLSRQEKYNWKRPIELFDERMRIPMTHDEIAKKYRAPATYTLDELKILFANATERVRLFMLLSLNCAFKQAEIGGLLKSEIFLNHTHDYYKVKGNFILRTRRKTLVYGEWKLWPETVAALIPATRQSKSKLAIETENGTSYGELTKGRNHNQKIQNLWRNLLRTVQKTHPDFRCLPFTSLVDTAVNMVRQQADGEVAKLFKAHGQVTSDSLIDLYSGRPYNKVFAALDAIYPAIKMAF